MAPNAHSTTRFSLFFLLLCLFEVITGLPAPLELGERAQNVLLGYNGFSAPPRPPQASAGGELGAVFYIADAVDLAALFAKGPNPAQDTICLIFADATEWSRQPKVWVPQSILNKGGSAVNSYFVGYVVFAAHTRAGLPAQAPSYVYQMGIRQAQIARLKLTTQCYPRAHFANDHTTLDYPSLNATWAIQTPPDPSA